MSFTLLPPTTPSDLRGKALVHWTAWHEAYPGLVSAAFLERMTLAKCEEIAFAHPENMIIAKDGGRVVGFVAWGDRGEEAPEVGEIFALYVLKEYYGKGVGRALMDAGLQALKADSSYKTIVLWVLKENRRAIRFYEKCGFRATGEEMYSQRIDAWEIRMALS